MMGAGTKIEWSHSTFNPWRGCAKVSAGCQNCYAEAGSRRNPGVLGTWGPDGTRVVAAESMWREPLKWDRAAKDAGERRRVFCASLADVFEDWHGGKDGNGAMTCHRTGEDLSINSNGHIWPIGWPSLSDGDDWGVRPFTMDDARKRLFRIIDATPNIDWLLLTKRPENIAKMMPQVRCTRCFGGPCDTTCPEQHRIRSNVWLGTSVEDQANADERIPHLLKVPAKVRFLSVEPLLGPVSLKAGEYTPTFMDLQERGINGPDWVIVGGESGHHARPCNIEWVRDIVRQCKDAGASCFVKQLGSRPYRKAIDSGNPVEPMFPLSLADPKGGNPSEWPEDLRVRENPWCHGSGGLVK